MLYQWLVLSFPYADDPPTPQGAFTPTPRYQVARIRDSCLNTLVHTGTQEAVDAIAALIAQHPSIPDAKYHLAVS